MRILVTRPAAQATLWVQALAQHGITAQALPLMAIAAAPDTAAVAAAWHQLPRYRVVMFVSANAVVQFFAQRPAHMAWPAAVQAASPGPGTTRALKEAGVLTAQIVEPAPDSAQFDSEALWQTLRQQDWHHTSVLVVRGDGGRDWLANTWRAHGAQVDFVAAYSRVPPPWDASAQTLLVKALEEPASHLWFFSSSESIDHLMAHLARRSLTLPLHTRALATHPRIAQRAQTAGFTTVWQSLPTLSAVVACIQSIAP